MEKSDFQHPSYVDELPRDLLVPHYLIHCYLYYKLDSEIINDHQFNQLARRLKKEWKKVSHRHKECLRRKELTITGCSIEYPLMVVGSAKSLIKH